MLDPQRNFVLSTQNTLLQFLIYKGKLNSIERNLEHNLAMNHSRHVLYLFLLLN
jgi:hypothetical protein